MIYVLQLFKEGLNMNHHFKILESLFSNAIEYEDFKLFEMLQEAEFAVNYYEYINTSYLELMHERKSYFDKKVIALAEECKRRSERS